MSNQFTVTFYDEDRKTILDRQEVEKGASVTYQGKTPEKPAENGTQYTFTGWEMTGNIEMVMENIDLFAKYEESSKMATKAENEMYQLSQENAENAKLEDVVQAGQKVSQAEKATRDMTVDQKKDLVNEVKDKGSVSLDKEAEQERD